MAGSEYYQFQVQFSVLSKPKNIKSILRFFSIPTSGKRDSLTVFEVKDEDSNKESTSPQYYRKE